MTKESVQTQFIAMLINVQFNSSFLTGSDKAWVVWNTDACVTAVSIPFQ